MTELESNIIKAAQKRDKHAFAQVYNHYSPFIWKVLYRMMNGDAQEAGQIMQDVFVKLFVSMKSYRFDAAFSTWLYRIAYTTALNHSRSKKRWWHRNKEIHENTEGKDPSQNIEQGILAERILSSLSRHERFLITAREVEGISFDELEIMTGKSAGSLRTQVSRIRESLRKEFSYAA